jgi:hypothetical protein
VSAGTASTTEAATSATTERERGRRRGAALERSLGKVLLR